MRHGNKNNFGGGVVKVFGVWWQKQFWGGKTILGLDGKKKLGDKGGQFF